VGRGTCGRRRGNAEGRGNAGQRGATREGKGPGAPAKKGSAVHAGKGQERPPKGAPTGSPLWLTARRDRGRSWNILPTMGPSSPRYSPLTKIYMKQVGGTQDVDGDSVSIRAHKTQTLTPHTNLQPDLARRKKPMSCTRRLPFRPPCFLFLRMRLQRQALWLQ
jgi:hypothetical protein